MMLKYGVCLLLLGVTSLLIGSELSNIEFKNAVVAFQKTVKQKQSYQHRKMIFHWSSQIYISRVQATQKQVEGQRIEAVLQDLENKQNRAEQEIETSQNEMLRLFNKIEEKKLSPALRNLQQQLRSAEDDVAPKFKHYKAQNGQEKQKALQTFGDSRQTIVRLRQQIVEHYQDLVIE